MRHPNAVRQIEASSGKDLGMKGILSEGELLLRASKKVALGRIHLRQLPAFLSQLVDDLFLVRSRRGHNVIIPLMAGIGGATAGEHGGAA